MDARYSFIVRAIFPVALGRPLLELLHRADSFDALTVNQDAEVFGFLKLVFLDGANQKFRIVMNNKRPVVVLLPVFDHLPGVEESWDELRQVLLVYEAGVKLLLYFLIEAHLEHGLIFEAKLHHYWVYL